MSEQQQVITLINNILQSTDNTLRGESQKLLNTMTETKISDLAIIFINILKTDQKDQIKQFIITHLRKSLSAFSEQKFNTVWGPISAENQQFIRSSLFECLQKETSASTRNMIADSIGQIAGTVMSINSNNWPNFTQFVLALLNHQTVQYISSGLIILENFFSFCPELFSGKSSQLIPIFQKSFEHESNKVKACGLKAFSGYVLSADKASISKLEQLMVPFYQVAYHLLVNDKGNSEGLEAISDIIEMEPKILKKSFLQLFELIENVIKIKDLESGIKRIGTQALISFAERYPALFRQNKEKLTSLIEMLFLHMIEIDEDISQQWKSPPEGYSEDFEEGEDFETTTFGMTSVDRLISSVGEKETLPVLSITVQKMLTMADWRYKFSSIMALSQTGEYIEDASSIKSIVEMLLNYLGDANPMLRFASCHAIGQISDDLKPHYQELYGKDSFLKLAALLKDSIPRVVSHSASALTNLIEGMKYQDISQYLPELMSALLELSTKGISLVKESALTTIASIAETMGQHFLPYFEKTSEILFSLVQSHNGKEYKQLKGLVIEGLTTIAQAIGKQKFQPALANLIQYMITVQDSQLEQVDPQKQYVLSGWQRLSAVYGKDLSQYLPQILPGLFKLIEQVIESSIKTSSLQNLVQQQNKQGQQIKINTFETDEAEISIDMLTVFIKEMGDAFIPYIERTTKIMLAIVQSMINESVKQAALLSLPIIITLLKSNDLEKSITYTKNFLHVLIEAALQEYDSEIQRSNLTAAKEIIQQYDTKFLTAEELKGYSDKVIKILLKSDERKNDTKGLTDDDLQDDEKELLDEEIVMQEEVQVAVSEIFGQLFKTHKEMNTYLIEYIIKNLLPKTLEDKASQTMNKFGIFLIDDMVQYLGHSIVGNIWADFHPIFIKYCSHKNLAVRQAACYGLGMYAVNTPAAVFTPFIQSSIKTLCQSAAIPKGSESEKTYGNCRDNSISAFGKIIKYHGSSFDPKQYLLVWLNYLPIKFDQGEALIQHELLTDILINSSNLLIQGQGPQAAQVILKILQIFGEIIQTKYVNTQITVKIKQVINNLKTLPLFIQNYDQFWSKLTEMQAVKLTLLVKEA